MRAHALFKDAETSSAHNYSSPSRRVQEGQGLATNSQPCPERGTISHPLARISRPPLLSAVWTTDAAAHDMMSGRSLRLQRASLHNIMPKPRRVGLGQRQLNTQLHQQPSPTSASSASEPQSSAETASEAKQGEMPPAQAAEVIVDAAKSKASRIADGLLASKVKAKAYAQNLLVGYGSLPLARKHGTKRGPSPEPAASLRPCRAMFLTAALMAALPFCATGPLAELLANRVFMCGFWAWLTAQVLKVTKRRHVRAAHHRTASPLPHTAAAVAARGCARSPAST